MSDALNYLMQVRPEAMKAYFGFLKESGRHLDPKTRAIISMITKVENQTEAGFRQYLNRALREGVTPDEVLDALLLAFPTLGLSRIIWAVDILLDMDIPEFRPGRLGGEASWHDVGPLSRFPVGGVSRLACDDRELFVYRTGDDVRVFDSRCPHQVTNIPELALDGLALTCPRHRWKFDLESGDCIENGDRPLKRFQHKLEAGRLWAFW